MTPGPAGDTVIRRAPRFSEAFWRNVSSAMERPPDAKLPARTRRSPGDERLGDDPPGRFHKAADGFVAGNAAAQTRDGAKPTKPISDPRNCGTKILFMKLHLDKRGRRGFRPLPRRVADGLRPERAMLTNTPVSRGAA